MLSCSIWTVLSSIRLTQSTCVDTLGSPLRFDTVTSPFGDTWPMLFANWHPAAAISMRRSPSYFRRNARKSMKSFPWPVRANCWNACRVTDGLLSPQPTEVCRKPECISPACQERRYSLPLKTSRRESPSPMVTGSPPKILVWIAKQRSCSKIQTPVFWRAGTPAAR